MFFELNYGYYFYISYKEDIDHYSQLKSVDKLLTELQKLMILYKKNLYHTQELYKQFDNKAIKSQSYTLYNKV